MRRQSSGRIVALAFIASFSSYSEAFHTTPSFLYRSSRHYGRGCALNKDDGYLSLVYVSDTSCVRGSSSAERRKAALAGYARHGFRVFGLQAEEGDIQKDDAGYSAEARTGLDEKTLEELWTRPKKHLLSVGRAGVKPSHVRSLNELVQAHTLVKVKINIPNADYAEVGRQLCGGLGINSTEEEGRGGDSQPTSQATISVVTSRAKQNMILFAKTEFFENPR